jgi:hypothetical protein
MPRSRDTTDTSNELSQLRAMLTELLNTWLVYPDMRVRAWTQDRLVLVEQRIRRERRLYGDAETAASIATHLISTCSMKESELGGITMRPQER